MPWRGPEYEGEFPTLGRDLVEWWEEHLKVPAGPLYGQPIALTADQAQFWIRFYALDEQGRRVYRRGSRRAAKGKGKSPEGAMFCIGEFCGPVQFDGWNAQGEPVGKPRDYPWVQIAACSEEQDHNLYGPMREMLAGSDLIDTKRIDLGKTRVEFADGRPGKIEPVSASSGAREGQPITAAALEETHLWFPSRGGPKLAAVLRRNAGKTNGVTCEFTNAPALGEGSVAEMTLDAANKATSGLLYDSMEGSYVEDPKNPANRDAVLISLAEAYDDGRNKGTPVEWVDVERQYAETQDPDVTEADLFRFYLNIARKSDNRAFDPTEFDALAEPGDIPTDEPLVLAYDGARTRDCAVFSAWTIGETPKHFHVAHWSRPWNATAGYQHPRSEYKATARDFIASHDVVLFAYDSSFHELDSLYDDWIDEFGEFDGKSSGLMLEFPTASGQRMQKAILQILEDTREGLYRHDGHEVITAHVHATVLSKNRGGWAMFAKEKDSLKIDGAVTMTFGYDLIPLARQAAENRTGGSVVFAFT